MSLICIECGKEYDPEGWDPMGGDCPRVRDSETGEVITPGYFVIGEDSIQLVNVPTLSGFLCRK